MRRMTTMLLRDGVPVAIVGASRWYAAPAFNDLDEQHRTAVEAIAQVLIATSTRLSILAAAPRPRARAGCTVAGRR